MSVWLLGFHSTFIIQHSAFTIHNSKLKKDDKEFFQNSVS